MKEIGSEYWNNETICSLTKNRGDWLEQVIFLSGRTAMDAIAEELEKQGKNRIYMPDYCCESMIVPFINRGMTVVFYRMDWKPGALVYHLVFDESFDILFIMQYFGYENKEATTLIQRAKRLGKIVIEDATHSMFQRNPFSCESDYVFASIRKWCALPGGAFFLEKGERGIKKPQKSFPAFLRTRREAEKEKERYIHSGKLENDGSFQKLFCKAETMLDREYAGYGLDAESQELLLQIDFERLAKIRRKNAVFLTEQLQGMTGIQVVFPEVKEGDVPLFVPILVEESRRESLQRYLIDRKIYCPIHWPVSNYVPWKEMLYQRELSIICDQRYGEEEMECIRTVIAEWTLRK